MIILSPSLVAFSCIWILYGGFDAWPINTEIPGMTLLFLEEIPVIFVLLIDNMFLHTEYYSKNSVLCNDNL